MKILKYPACAFLSLFCVFGVVTLFERVNPLQFTESPESPVVVIYAIAKVVLFVLAVFCPWIAWNQAFKKTAKLEEKVSVKLRVPTDS